MDMDNNQVVYKIVAIRTVPVGRVVTRKINPGIVITLTTNQLTTEVKSMEGHHKYTTCGNNGGGFNVENVSPLYGSVIVFHVFI